jgi:catechol 2,3-dioxygenase-like lactoylglutathione lyase family enzyme
MSSTPRFGMVVEYVDDVASARSFYVDVLGLRVDRDGPEFIQFADPAGVNLAIASDGSLSGTREPEIYWVVEDAAAALQGLPTTAEISYPLTRQPFGTVFGVRDPAGQTQYFLEFARERPSVAAS